VQVHCRGDVIQVKVLGIMALIDEGKTKHVARAAAVFVNDCIVHIYY